MNGNRPVSNEDDITANVAAVVEKAKDVLAPILDKSGSILYSSCETLKRGRYYFLGFNPGGSEEGTDTIRDSLSKLPTYRGNALLKGDETADWSDPPKRTYPQGEHPLQKRFKGIFEALEVEDLRSICASNMIFTRSPKKQGARYPDMAELCWPVHKLILEIIRPDAIIMHGHDTFDFVAKTLGGGSIESFPFGTYNTIWRRSILANGVKLVGLPGLSQYAPNQDVIDKVAQFV
jgi:hypothetical protein